MKTFDKKKEKVVTAGKIIGNTFVKYALPKHYMIKEKGYGIQKDVIDGLLDMGIIDIKILTKTTEYKSTLFNWVLKGHIKDYGHGKQVFLPVKEMVEL